MRRRVGVLGGGQLGMMLAGSLFKLGADVFLYDPDPRSPAKRRYANVMTGGFRDEEALSRFVAQCDVLTYEFENVEADGLRAVVGDVPIFPSLDVLQTTQHRAEEKRFCQRAGLPHARFAIAGSADELRAAGRAFGYPHLVKVARGGYDGKGQHRVTDEASLDRVATELSAAFDGGFGVVLEELVPFVLEASCIVARSDTGEEVVFPVFENQHEHHVLDVTVVPARVPADVSAALGELALRAARELGVIGLLTTEFFVARAADVPATSTTGLRVGEHVVYVNEFAPRPHNSGHVTRSACNFSQFDAHARVLVGMPIGKPRLMAEGYYAMGNLLGDLWVKRGGELDFAQWARHPEVVDILLYGKHDARPGRKMGHFVAHGSTADAVIAAAKAFRRDLVGGLRARALGPVVDHGIHGENVPWLLARGRSTPWKMSDSTAYVPPKVWSWTKKNGGVFANINRPVAGPTHEKALPVGRHPLQLYSLATPNGVKVTVLLEELLAAGHAGAEYDAWLIKIDEGEQFGSGFVDVNPNAKIPALVDRSGPVPVRVFESGAILLYLAEKFGAFLPTEHAARTEALSWLFWQIGAAPYLGGGFGHFYAYAPTKIEYAIDRYAMEVKRQLDVLDRRLAEARYLAGSEYTIADMAVWPWYGALVQGKVYGAGEFLSVHEYTNVLRWTGEIAERPAVKRGRIVNRTFGKPAEQLHERHDASDFDKKTQDKVRPAG